MFRDVEMRRSAEKMQIVRLVGCVDARAASKLRTWCEFLAGSFELSLVLFQKIQSLGSGWT